MRFTRITGVLCGAALAAGAAVLSSVTPSAACGVHCGTYRWAIKTIAPATVPSSWANATETVDKLNAIPRPSPNPGKTAPRTAPVETTMYKVTACLFGITGQKDQDYHLMINDLVSNDKTMIVEVPNIACSDACASPYSAHYTAVRQALETAPMTRAAVRELKAKLREQRKTGEGDGSAVVLITVPVKLTTEGAGFWDMRGHGKGHSDNGIELHPIVDIALTTTKCAGPSLARIHEILTERDERDEK